MGSYYQKLDTPWFDYQLFSIHGLPREGFRGPDVDLSKPYAACIGAAQTFGRFVGHPFPQILSERLQLPFLNLAVGGVGPRHYLNDAYLDILNRAETVIVQVLSGRSASNSLFDNHEHGDLVGKRLSDNKEMRFENFFAELCATASQEVVARIVSETRRDYVETFSSLLSKITAPKILLWLSDRDPKYEYPLDQLGSYPQLVNARMLQEISEYADERINVVSSAGVPQKLWKSEEEIDGASLQNGYLYNRYYPTPEIHVEAANLLEPVCRRLTGKSLSISSARGAGQNKPRRFVVLGPERSGTHLLLGMLESSYDCSIGDELFNEYYVDRKEIPWPVGSPADRGDLDEMRRTRPVEFIERMFELAEAQGCKASGFKVMYWHAERVPEVKQYILSNRDLAVIHMRRRNLLERYVSEMRAHSTGIWSDEKGALRRDTQNFNLDIGRYVHDIAEKDQYFRWYSSQLAGREVFNIYYENLSNDPVSVGKRAFQFLNLKTDGDLPIKFEKSAQRAMAETVNNYDEIKSRLRFWSSF